MVSVHELKGKEVYAKRGIKIGKVEDVELDDNNWSVKALDVRMNEDIAKIYGEKAGFMKKEIIPLPAEMLGPIGDNVTLKEEIKDFDAIRESMRTERSF
ncbi:MAG: PRC-barrel domain-containing protein [Candidatus Bathyarchaeia archaeon]